MATTGGPPGGLNESTVDPFHRGSNQSGLRARNQRLVLTLVRRHGALPKSDIARMTGLSAQTVSVIMRELEGEGLLRRGKPNRVRGKVGQPSVPLSLVPGGALFFGLTLGRRSSDLVLIDFLGEVVDNVHHTYRYPTPDQTVRFTHDAVSRITERLAARQKRRIAGLGIGLPFRLWDWAETVGAPKPVMDAWREADIRAQIAADCAFPVYLENDATAACAAELVFGRDTGLRDFLYFYIDYFIGGGIVLNGSLYTGHSGNAGALGPMPVPAGADTTRQLIDVASIACLERAIQRAGGDSSSLWETPVKWDVDEALLDTWVEDTANGMAYAIVAASSVVDFEAVVIDGWLPAPVRAAIVEATQRRVQSMNLTGLAAPVVRPGTVGYGARAIGAASLPLSHRFLVDQNALLQQR